MTRKGYATLRHPKMHPHTKWDSYLKAYRRNAPETMRDRRTDSVVTICLPKFLWVKTRSEVKVIVSLKCYTTLRHPKMHPHTKFEIPTSNNKDMLQTRLFLLEFREWDVSPGKTEVKQGKIVEFISPANGYFRELLNHKT